MNVWMDVGDRLVEGSSGYGYRRTGRCRSRCSRPRLDDMNSNIVSSRGFLLGCFSGSLSRSTLIVNSGVEAWVVISSVFYSPSNAIWLDQRILSQNGVSAATLVLVFNVSRVRIIHFVCKVVIWFSMVLKVKQNWNWSLMQHSARRGDNEVGENSQLQMYKCKMYFEFINTLLVGAYNIM